MAFMVQLVLRAARKTVKTAGVYRAAVRVPLQVVRMVFVDQNAIRLVLSIVNQANVTMILVIVMTVVVMVTMACSALAIARQIVN